MGCENIAFGNMGEYGDCENIAFGKMGEYGGGRVGVSSACSQLFLK